MTSVAQSRLNTGLALAIPAGAFLYLTSSGSVVGNPSAVGVTLGLGALWLAAVVALNTRSVDGGSLGARAKGDVAPVRVPARAEPPAYGVNVSQPREPWRWTGVNVSQPREPWRWTSVLLAPLELLAVVWSIPFVILLIMLPLGAALAAALWLGALILNRF
jgi:hypothetical protein